MFLSVSCRDTAFDFYCLSHLPASTRPCLWGSRSLIAHPTSVLCPLIISWSLQPEEVLLSFQMLIWSQEDALQALPVNPNLQSQVYNLSTSLPAPLGFIPSLLLTCSPRVLPLLTSFTSFGSLLELPMSLSQEEVVVNLYLTPVGFEPWKAVSGQRG